MTIPIIPTWVLEFLERAERRHRWRIVLLRLLLSLLAGACIILPVVVFTLDVATGRCWHAFLYAALTAAMLIIYITVWG